MKKLSLTQKILEKNYVLLIISVVISIVIWVYMSMNATNDTTVTISNIPIQIELSDSAKDLGLQVFSGDTTTASVTLTGDLTGDYIGTVSAKEDHPLKHPAGQVYGDDAYSVFQIGNKDELTYTIYMFFEDKQSAGDTITLFDTMKIPAAWDNAEMAIMNGMEIKVNAYAVQANGFTGTYPCYDAMVAAFGQNTGDPFKF